MPELLWAQYALFLCVRLQDDVIDEQCEKPALLLCGDSLLIESERTLAKYVSDPAFWTFFRQCVDTTIRAIVSVDTLQRSGQGITSETVRLYADVAAIFKVGSAAACMGGRHRRALAHLFTFADELAIASQIIDDVHDLDEDFRRGRLNFAATRFGLDRSVGVAEAARRVTHGIFAGHILESLTEEVERHLDRAAAAAARARVTGATAYVDGLRTRLPVFRRAWHRMKVEHVLGRLRSPAGAPAPA